MKLLIDNDDTKKINISKRFIQNYHKKDIKQKNWDLKTLVNRERLKDILFKENFEPIVMIN